MQTQKVVIQSPNLPNVEIPKERTQEEKKTNSCASKIWPVLKGLAFISFFGASLAISIINDYTALTIATTALGLLILLSKTGFFSSKDMVTSEDEPSELIEIIKKSDPVEEEVKPSEEDPNPNTPFQPIPGSDQTLEVHSPSIDHSVTTPKLPGMKEIKEGTLFSPKFAKHRVLKGTPTYRTGTAIRHSPWLQKIIKQASTPQTSPLGGYTPNSFAETLKSKRSNPGVPEVLFTDEEKATEVKNIWKTLFEMFENKKFQGTFADKIKLVIEMTTDSIKTVRALDSQNTVSSGFKDKIELIKLHFIKLQNCENLKNISCGGDEVQKQLLQKNIDNIRANGNLDSFKKTIETAIEELVKNSQQSKEFTAQINEKIQKEPENKLLQKVLELENQFISEIDELEEKFQAISKALGDYIKDVNEPSKDFEKKLTEMTKTMEKSVSKPLQKSLELAVNKLIDEKRNEDSEKLKKSLEALIKGISIPKDIEGSIQLKTLSNGIVAKGQIDGNGKFTVVKSTSEKQQSILEELAKQNTQINDLVELAKNKNINLAACKDSLKKTISQMQQKISAQQNIKKMQSDLTNYEERAKSHDEKIKKHTKIIIKQAREIQRCLKEHLKKSVD